MDMPQHLIEENSLTIYLHKEFYEPEAIRAAAFKYSSICYIFFKPFDTDEYIVRFEQKNNDDIDLERTAKEYCNDLLDQQIRIDLEKRNGKIKNLIVQQAFKPVEDL